MKGETLSFDQSGESLLGFQFPAMEIVASGVEIANGFEGDLIGSAIAVEAVQKSDVVGRRRGSDVLRERTEAAERGFSGQSRSRGL
jgi:hypothetical protein